MKRFFVMKWQDGKWERIDAWAYETADLAMRWMRGNIQPKRDDEYMIMDNDGGAHLLSEVEQWTNGVITSPTPAQLGVTPEQERQLRELWKLPAPQPATPPAVEPGSYKKARGVFERQEGDEPAEVSIRRIRDGSPPADAVFAAFANAVADLPPALTYDELLALAARAERAEAALAQRNAEYTELRSRYLRQQARNVYLRDALQRIYDSEDETVSTSCPLCAAVLIDHDDDGTPIDATIIHDDTCPFDIAREALNASTPNSE